ncbi:ig-like domain-containing protein [Trichonephila clavipes]|nr:ig-like domain-containing protein [Trichonephila clavipes]
MRTTLPYPKPYLFRPLLQYTYPINDECPLVFQVPSPLTVKRLSGGREHSVSGKVGESVVLPCEVDSHGCGRIYVITWTKHIGDEWRRVYLYSDTHSRPMNAFAGRAHFVLHNNSNAELHLRALSVADEGTYKCDVTYVHGKCPSLTFTKLFTLSE